VTGRFVQRVAFRKTYVTIHPHRSRAGHVYEEVVFRFVSATVLISTIFQPTERPPQVPTVSLLRDRW